MKIGKKIVILLFFICLCISLFYILQIYAKYLTSATGTTSIPISKWNISINNSSIQNNSDFSATLVPVFPGTSHIASNTIAPTAEGYFDINLDFTNVDVSFEYTISTHVNTASLVQDFVATGYSINSGEVIPFSSFNEDIEGTVLYSDTNRTKSIRIYIMWNDDSNTGSMNNAADTYPTTVTNSVALFDALVSFTQITQNPATV